MKIHEPRNGLLITYRCNAWCRHCAYGCKPTIEGKMYLKDTKKYIEQLKDDLKVVCISGGEPFLYYDLLVKLVEYAAKVGVPSIWIFTNAFWIRNDKSP